MTEEKKSPTNKISINGADIRGHEKPTIPRSSEGWDGKARIEKKIDPSNPEALSDSEHSNNDVIVVGDTIEADEERFKKVAHLCLRQNSITEIEGLSCLASTLTELDLYDNLISHIRHLDDLYNLTSLDLSFNKIKHIKNISCLTSLTDLFFVQNRISRIENLSGLTKLRNLELAANRIRKIEGLETLLGLEELWLGKNKITEIECLDTLQSLKILSIQSNRLTEISGLTQQKNLEELYISHNALENLTGLESCSSLRILDISNNKVSSLQGLERLLHLQELWASYNELDNFKEVESVLGDKKELVTVYFEGNPLQLKGPTVYRNKIKLALPQLLQIDACYFRQNCVKILSFAVYNPGLFMMELSSRILAVTGIRKLSGTVLDDLLKLLQKILFQMKDFGNITLTFIVKENTHYIYLIINDSQLSATRAIFPNLQH
ncbi:Protein phosphatase 1 regulatory subunit SDS22 [Erysiphe neolycopersici]|uniref:Protein phosphatase 1 regulatory subunit SDS22 n=1 Tax=Erysiphe neolycopersici TaxID=212602 RepID=A0A420I713_9PEZI|nr:Protein phosphatase 1 regulatory subunit SDS22 [Erysiphe neolycopersici]